MSTQALIEKGSQVGTYAGASISFFGGIVTLNEIGIIAGIVLGVLSLLINTSIAWYFKNKNYKLKEREVLMLEKKNAERAGYVKEGAPGATD